MLIRRHLHQPLHDALDHFRVVVLHGARQSGKTTLARSVTEQRGGTYTTLDDDATREAALDDPLTFLVEQPGLLTVDEVQLGGDRLVRAIKRVVDSDPTPGRILLTGSTNFLTVPVISESLAGRVRILRLWPFSEAERIGQPVTPVEEWFSTPSSIGRGQPEERLSYLERLCQGGYPEVVALEPSIRHAWFDSYVETVTLRDIYALADIRRKAALPRLLRWMAAATASELNVTATAGRLGLDRSTAVSYLEWLRTVFLVHELPAWSPNFRSRAVRRPKIHFSDTGLATHLLGAGPAMLAKPTSLLAGPLLETFTVNEVSRQLSASSARVATFHYRDPQKREVDLIMERPDGALVAIEVKATRSPTKGHLRHVRWLRDKLDTTAPGTFRAGILFHTGPQSLTVGDRLHLRPISTLWSPPA